MDVRGALFAMLFLSAHPPIRLSAQDTTRAPQAVPTDSARPDSVKRHAPVRPFGAMWRSMLIPGWGQAVSGRHVTGAVFVAWEGVTAMMTLKARDEAKYLKETQSPLLKSKRQEIEDWAVLWVFNHLFAGAEAFVAAHLRDFPPDLRLRAVPGGFAIRLYLR